MGKINVLQVIEQILTQLADLQAGQPVTIKVGPEQVNVAGLNLNITEQVIIQKAA